MPDAACSPDPAIDRRLIASIWREWGLGSVRSIRTPARGGVNPARIVNGTHVIRFQARDPRAARFLGERLAFRLLEGTEVPVPAVAAFDASLKIAPCPFLITGLLPGECLLDIWPALSPDEKKHAAREAGRLQALIHGIRLRGFGDLGDLESGGFPTWSAYLFDYFDRHARLARDQNLVKSSVLRRLETVLHSLEPVWRFETQGSLLHSDYHWENILYAGGTITGVVDFEWAMSGDPVFDCRIDSRLEARCPGSLEPFYEGYDSVRVRGESHSLKARLYETLLNLESVAAWSDRSHEDWYRREREDLAANLEMLEAGRFAVRPMVNTE